MTDRPECPENSQSTNASIAVASPEALIAAFEEETNVTPENSISLLSPIISN
jgi:hypothetical protein